MSLKQRPVVMGFSASVALLIVYFGIVSLSESFEHAILQFREIWYWITLLVTGFGIQVGLYSYVRAALRAREIAGATTSLAAASGVSTTSMVACCAHHLTDVFAIIGLSALSAVLAKYQLLFIILGILSNFVGITLMLEVVQTHGIGGRWFGSIMSFDMTKAKWAAIYLSVFLFSVSFFVTYSGAQQGFSSSVIATSAPSTLSSLPVSTTLPTRAVTQDSIEFAVTPSFSQGGEVAFEIGITTHSGSLDFDLAQISTLEDDSGNRYSPLSWEGSPTGGHHRSGKLAFPPVEQTGTLTLIIVGVGIEDRVFSWDIRQ
ncbi:hypothetical protein BMS3Bbin16_01290 [archaeon BMS3Bbin16]|nr:hypothetical protein BMS3Bbin16_01290 [archaeon BMS3Bbin16]